MNFAQNKGFDSLGNNDSNADDDDGDVGDSKAAQKATHLLSGSNSNGNRCVEMTRMLCRTNGRLSGLFATPKGSNMSR